MEAMSLSVSVALCSVPFTFGGVAVFAVVLEAVVGHHPVAGDLHPGTIGVVLDEVVLDGPPVGSVLTDDARPSRR